MPRELERRNTAIVVELRDKKPGVRSIGGYAAVFNRYSDNLGGFVERVAPGFFNKSNGDGWPGVIARYNHSDDYLLGTTAAGTLRLTIDDTGLDYAEDLPSTRADIAELVERGDVRQSSFAFVAYEDEWGETEQGIPLRTLVSGRAVDVAPVNTPAYSDATVGLRSLAEKFDADFTEVRAMAKNNELRKLLHRSDPKDPKAIEAMALRRARLDLIGKR